MKPAWILFTFLFFFGKMTAEERLSSAPYISGDTFRAHCDFIFDETNDVLNPKEVSFGNTLFVKTDFIGRFFEEIHPQIAEPYVLVTHNSDYPIPGNYGHMLSEPKLLAWFGQNLENYKHPKLHPLPIGLANQRWPHGKIEILNRVNKDLAKEHLLYLNFEISNNYSLRAPLYHQFAHQPFCFLSEPKSWQEYLADIARSEFVLSPRGNGLDCHRTWEALYLGAVPIVASSMLDPLFENLPVVIVDDWKQVNEEFLKQKSDELNQKTFQCQKIWANYWFDQIDAYKKPRPIQFSIPECKVVQEIPKKSKDFARLVPGNMDTYVYYDESSYYQDYQKSYFAITCKKGGWDTLRHYEILANGCIPYFLDLENCDPKTLPFLPKELIHEAMHLEGVSLNRIDHEKFDKKRYFEILEKLLQHVRSHLTTRSMAQYLLDAIGHSGKEKILYLSEDLRPDYLRCLTLIGLKEILGDQITDFPKIEHLYQSYSGNPKELYGKGFSYTKILEDLPLNRDNIEQRIRDQEFAFIIYGSAHRGMKYHELVSRVYDPAHIVYLCGEEGHHCEYSNWPNVFIRESTDFDPSAPKKGGQKELEKIYLEKAQTPSDINEHLPLLKQLASECSHVVEIGVRSMVSTWGILQGLSESLSPHRSYVGIDLELPPWDTLQKARVLAEAEGISFQFWKGNDMLIDIHPVDMLFIDSLHTYCHLTYELEKFSPKVSKYITLHDTSAPWGMRDDTEYKGDYSEYSASIDRKKRGLWPAVVDFLKKHPEWVLLQRHYNNHGFTVLKRI